MNKYGVRIYPLGKGRILVKQTVKRQGSQTYVVDTLPKGLHREAHVDITDGKGIAAAVQTALKGKLLRSI